MDDYEKMMVEREDERIRQGHFPGILNVARAQWHEAVLHAEAELAALKALNSVRYMLSGVPIEILGDVAERVSGQRSCTVEYGLRLGKEGQWRVSANGREWYIEEKALFKAFEEKT